MIHVTDKVYMIVNMETGEIYKSGRNYTPATFTNLSSAKGIRTQLGKPFEVVEIKDSIQITHWEET